MLKMPRDTVVLSEKELFLKTKQIPEHVRKCKIYLHFSKGDNFCQFKYGDNESRKGLKNARPCYHVNIATPPVKNINKYVALIHELGHILYESPFRAMKNIFAEWGIYASLGLAVYNILEDQRIESHLAKNYRAYASKFLSTRKKLGIAMRSSDNSKENPLFILMAIRFQRYDLINDVENLIVYRKAMQNVELSDKFGGLRVLITLKKYIEEYVNKRNKTLEKLPESKYGNDSMVREKTKEIKDETFFNEIIDSKNYEIPKDLEEILNSKESPTKEMLHKMIENGKLLGESQSKEVRSKMTEGLQEKILPPNVRKIKREQNDFKVNLGTAKKLTSVFNKIKMRERESISEEGYDIDVEEYVERFIDGHNLSNCLIGKRDGKGASIIVSVDGSTSMEYRMEEVRRLVATLYESVKDLSSIDIRGNVWSSNRNGNIGITEVNNIKDVSKISCEREYFATPTHMGLEYTKRMLKEMKGSKKFVIVITDGSPNYYSKGRRVPKNEYMKQCKKSMQKLLGETRNVICIAMMPNKYQLERVEYLFGKNRVISVDTWNFAAENIIKQFKRIVVGVLQ